MRALLSTSFVIAILSAAVTSAEALQLSTSAKDQSRRSSDNDGGAHSAEWSILLPAPTGSGHRVQYTAANTLLTPSHLIYTDREGVNHALRRSDGTEAWNTDWSAGLGLLGYYGGDVYFSGNENGHLRSYSSSSGRENWGLGSLSGSPSGLLFTAAGSRVTAQFANSQDGMFVTQLSTADGSVNWTFPSVANDVSSTQCSPGIIVGMSNTFGEFVTWGISLTNGAKLWTADLYGSIHGCYTAASTGKNYVVGLNSTDGGHHLVTLEMTSGSVGVVSAALPGYSYGQGVGIISGQFCYKAKTSGFSCYGLSSGSLSWTTTSLPSYYSVFYGAKYISFAYSHYDSSSGKTKWHVKSVHPSDGSSKTSVSGRTTHHGLDIVHFFEQISVEQEKILVSFSQSDTNITSVEVVNAASGTTTSYDTGLSNTNKLRSGGVQYDASTGSLFLLTKDHAVKLSNV